jgi:hypothetical protein
MRYPNLRLVPAPRAGASLVLAALLLGGAPVHAADPQPIPMTPDRWTLGADVKFVEHRGVPAIEFGKSLMGAEALIKDLIFKDGTIEFDAEPVQRMGPAIAFRRRDGQVFESFYLRSFPDCATRVDCVQYAPVVHGVLMWDIYPAHQAPARVKSGEWNRVKMVISGRRMRVYINGGDPALVVDRLEGDTLEGAVALQGMGFVANVKVTPGAVEGLPSTPADDPTLEDARIVRNWQISAPSKLPAASEPSLTTLPAAKAGWAPFPAETGGLVNVTRRYGLTEERSMVWLRTTIRADAKTDKRAAIGWNDEVWVFVNRKPVYADKNLYQDTPAEKRKTPDGRLSLENGAFTLPLEAGDNEVVVALANKFFGWGLMLRLDDADRITLATPAR